MAIEITVDSNEDFEVSADIETSFALLSNVLKSSSHFPRVQSIQERDDNVFEWILEGETMGSTSYGAEYASRYFFDSEKKTVHWEPVKGFGNSEVTGRWTFQSSGSGTKIHFENHVVMTFEISRFLKAVAVPLVRRLSASLTAEYLTNVKTTLNGGQGHLREPVSF